MYRISCFLCIVDVQVMLMTDILVFMQEKDQRYIFASLVSLHVTHPVMPQIVRFDRGMCRYFSKREKKIYL